MKRRQGAAPARRTTPIFLSYATEDAALAVVLKEWLTTELLEQVDIMVSGDGESLQGGEEWLESIRFKMRRAKLVLVLCTSTSVVKPFWIPFETGGAFFLNKPFIPLCTSKELFEGLPLPLRLRQGYDISLPAQLRQLMKCIAEIAGLATPRLHRAALKRLTNLIPLPPAESKVALWIGRPRSEDQGLLEQIQSRFGDLKYGDAEIAALVKSRPALVVFRLKDGDVYPSKLIDDLRAAVPEVHVMIYSNAAWVALHPTASRPAEVKVATGSREVLEEFAQTMGR